MRDYFVFAAVLLVTLLGCAGIALPYPILAPLFMDGQVNGLNSFAGFSPELLLGVALAIYPLGILIGSSFIGALSDTFGRKKVLVWTLFISILGYLASAYAIVHENYLLFVASRLFTGLCEGNVSIARAIALDLGKTIDKTRAMSLVSAATFIGWLIGPLAGGYLAEYGSHVAFEAGAYAIAACMLLAIFAIRETHQVEQDSGEKKGLLALMRANNSVYLLANPVIMGMFIFQLTFTLGLNAFYEFYPVWLVTDRDHTPADIGQVTAIMTVFMTLASIFVVTGLKRAIGIRGALILSLLGCAMAMALLPMANQWLMLAVFAFSGICISIYNGLLPVYMSDTHPEVGSGALMGLLTMIFCLSNTIMALIGSVLLIYGAELLIYVAGVLMFIAALLLMRYIRIHDHGDNNNAQTAQA